MSTLKPKPKVRSAAKRPAKRPVEGVRWKNVVSAPDEHYQLKKQAVIAEAARAFGRHGANNVSLDQIAAALNVTKPALYYYFKNKQELIYECHELVMRIGDQVLEDAVASESTGYVRITTFIKNYLAVLTDQFGAPAILHDFSAMTPSDQNKIVLRRRRFTQQLRQILGSVLVHGCCQFHSAVVSHRRLIARRADRRRVHRLPVERHSSRQSDEPTLDCGRRHRLGAGMMRLHPHPCGISTTAGKVRDTCSDTYKKAVV